MTPTGRLHGTDLLLTRSFRAPAEDVWASVTEPERTARWFGAWTGEARAGGTIEVQLGFEDGAPWCAARIEACEPPRRLALSMSDEAGDWRLEVLLAEAGGVTELTLVHHLEDVGSVGEVGPGWEYYLDLLVAARDGTPRPSFDDYYPALKPHFEALR
ncbi:SRPBCC family protein [Actinokineospora sp. NPDC004072]